MTGAQQNEQITEKLAEETTTIGYVLTAIRAIANQTNLLYLNAAIESACDGTTAEKQALIVGLQTAAANQYST